MLSVIEKYIWAGFLDPALHSKRVDNEVGPTPYGFAAKRLRVYTRLNNWNVFGAGWVNRIADLLEAMKSS
jgi:hypothetical protein